MTISPINLGNTFTNGSGSAVIGGLSSGLNTQSTINSIVAAQSAQITPLQDQVTVNNSQLSALTQLQQLLTSLQAAAAPLSNPQSPDTSSNLWAVNTSNITSNTTQAASNYLSTSVTSDAVAGSYTISNISQLATATTQQTTTTFTSATAAVVAASGAGTGEFNAGTINITGPGGSGTVTLNTGDSLNQVAADFNDATATTGIQATVLQTSPGVYQLVFSSTMTGANSQFDLTSSGTVTSDPSNALSQISFQTMTTANEGQDAEFDLNGVAITRPTNTISDLISGVTLNLLQNTSTEPSASFTLSIAPDTASITEGIQNFASAYNNFLAFYATQTQLNSSGTPASAAVLYSDTALNTIYNQVTNEASSIVQGIANNSPNTLASLGITFVTEPASGTTPAINNALSVDTATLQGLLTSNFSGVESVFGASMTSSSSNLALYQSPTVSGVTNINLSISGGVYTATYTDPTTKQQTTATLTATSLGTGGVVLNAPSTGALAGLSLIYTGNGSDSPVSITLTQGIVSQVNNSLTSYLTANTGLVATDQTAIQTKNTTINTQITSIQNQVATTRSNLLQQFSQLEEAITQANSALNYLNAQQLASSSGG